MKAVAIACVVTSLLGGCKRAPEPTNVSVPAATDAAGSTPVAAHSADAKGPIPGDAASARRGDAESGEPEVHATKDLTPFATAKPLSGKSIGHTSVVFKLKLTGDLVAAYKPASTRGPTRYKGEIAAYRLALALGLENVPPAVPHSFPLADLLAALGGKDSEAGGLLAKEGIADEHGNLPGALIPWIPHLGFLAIEAPPLLTEWRGWVEGRTTVPPEKRGLAGQISTLIVFDCVTANWDRWSGGNVGWDEPKGELLFIDNDAAFYEKPPTGLVMAQWVRMQKLTRFSRSFVERLRRLDAGAIRAAIGDEAQGVPLLTEKALAGVIARRDRALREIDGRIKQEGEANALPFD